jgi:hypothetical protein
MQRMLAIRHHRTRGLKKPELDEELIEESDQNHPIESRGPSRPMVLQTIVERERAHGFGPILPPSSSSSCAPPGASSLPAELPKAPTKTPLLPCSVPASNTPPPSPNHAAPSGFPPPRLLRVPPLPHGRIRRRRCSSSLLPGRPARWGRRCGHRPPGVRHVRRGRRPLLARAPVRPRVLR